MRPSDQHCNRQRLNNQLTRFTLQSLSLYTSHPAQVRSSSADPHLTTLLAHILQLRCHFSFTSAAPAVPRSAQSPAPPTAAPLISAERYMTSTYHVTHHSQQSAVLEVRMELHESRLCSSLSHHKSTT